jgi:hypothetical protein
MASVVQICNLALSKIGSPPISALTEDSREAQACSMIYEPLRDEVLQIRPWASCTKRVALAMLSDVPAFEFSAAWQLPADFLDMVRLGDTDNETINHRIEGRTLLTSTTTANIIYIFRNDDSGTYEPVLVDLIASRMAVDLAMTVAQSAAMAQALYTAYEQKRQRAKSVDGQANGQPSFTTVTFLDARL